MFLLPLPEASPVGHKGGSAMPSARVLYYLAAGATFPRARQRWCPQFDEFFSSADSLRGRLSGAFYSTYSLLNVVFKLFADEEGALHGS